MRRDFEEKFDLIVDANDSILERVVRVILSTIFTTVFKITHSVIQLCFSVLK
jgi:hypothetical protein